MSKLGALHSTLHTGAKHTGTVIIFHGSGGTGESMKEWMQLMVKSAFCFPHLKILFPTAPLRRYSPAGGALSYVWFDRTDISPRAPEHEPTLKDIELEVKSLIKKENDIGIPSARIVVGGFSMGGALALHTSYRWDKELAGVFAYSSFLNDRSLVYQELKKSAGAMVPPLLQLHGDQDEMVDMQWGRDTYDQLSKCGVRGEFHVLERLGHSLNRKGVAIIKAWLEKTLPQ